MVRLIGLAAVQVSFTESSDLLRDLAGDDAWWTCRLVDEIFPKAIQIVNLYHAKEKMWDVANWNTEATE